MGRRGSSAERGDGRDGRGARSGRGGGRSRLGDSQITSALREAQQLQQEGDLESAIQICEELLDEGINRPDVHYFLGWLYQEADRWDEAAGQFDLLLDDPEYALSCYYALGQCARAQGNVEEAARFFDEAVDRVNLDALASDESSQLLQLCQEAAEAHRDMNDLEGAETIYSALLGFLRSQGWQDQAADVERMMHETLGTAPPRRRKTASPARPGGTNMPQRHGARSRGDVDPMLGSQPLRITGQLHGMSGQMAAMSGQMPAPALGGGMGALVGGASGFPGQGAMPPVPGTGDQLAQLINHLNGVQGMRSKLASLPEPQRAQVAQAVREIENYVAHGLLTAAIEECLRVMEIAPQYLDVHLLLGEIYVRQGKIEQAVAKYAVLVDTYLVNGRVDDAIATYHRILQLEPNNLTYRVKLIELLSRQGRTDEVLTERIAAADSYLRLGYADRAIQEYEQALLAHPNNTHIRLGYATALLRAGRAAQAVGEYQRVLQVDPTNVQALAHWQMALATGIGTMPGMSAPGVGSSRVASLEVLNRLLRALRNERFASYSDVVQAYVQAAEQTPTNGDLRYALGQIHLATAHTQEALTCFQQIASTPGLEVMARYATGQALLATGDAVSAGHAVRELEEASGLARRSPPDPATWDARPRGEGEEHLAPEMEVSLLLARAYQLSGQVAQMQATLQAVKDHPHNDEVYRVLAEVSARQGDTQAVLQEYAQLVRRYRGNRQVENAVTVLREMARLAPDDPAVHSELADIQIQRGLLDEGILELRQLADIYMRRGQLRDVAMVYQRVAEVSWGTNNQEDALNLLRQAIQYATDDMALRQQLVQYCLEMNTPQSIREATEQQTVIARYYFASRQTKEAVAALQQLIAMDRNHYEAYDLLGQTYYSVGEYEQAARVYRNLAKVDPNNVMARARLAELQSVRSQFG
ncbi:MAG: tetratricopeptide repeat protein [Ktedonobacterales bacterium]|nr:tetratricopeptide repeat protein [Ktedonobacterales bacterium]